MFPRLFALAVLATACSSAGEPVVNDARAIDAPRFDARSDTSIDAPRVADPCFPDPAAGHRNYTCNGIVFDIEVPPACVNGGCGIILDVHGLTMSGVMEEANDGLRARGSAAGFVVIQPSANPAPPQASWGATDEPKVFDILQRAIAVYAIDPRRVHMTGFSQGGFMTWRFVCQHAEAFASVAPAAAASNCPPVVGPAACTFTGTEVPSRKLPILYMHGRQDMNYVNFSCAQPQVDAIVSAWSLTPNGVIASDATFTRTRWSDGAGTVVEFLAHDYSSNQQVPLISQTKLLGHCFPGSTDPGGQPGQLFPFGCEQPASFVWGAEVVSWFLAHPRPQ